MKNINKKTALFAMLFALIGIVSTANSSSPFAQNDSKMTKSIKEDGGKCGEGKCGNTKASKHDEASEEAAEKKCGDAAAEKKCGDNAAEEKCGDKAAEKKCGDKEESGKKCGE